MTPKQLRRAAESAFASERWQDAYSSAREWLEQGDPADRGARRAMLRVLGSAALDLPSPEPEEIEFAIGALTEALVKEPRDAHNERGSLSLGLGLLYEVRGTGDARHNNERAVQYLRDALGGNPKEGDPITWASIHSTIGLRYAERVGQLAPPSFAAMRADLAAAEHEFEVALRIFDENELSEESGEMRSLIRWCRSSIASLDRRAYPPDPPKKLGGITRSIGWRRR